MFTTILIGILISLFAILSALILITAYFSPILRKIGFRNVRRRLGNTILVVIGSMVGTALISGSLVLGDSFDKSFVELVERQIGEIDATITVTNTAENPSFLTVTTPEESAQILKQLATVEGVDGILPAVMLSVAPQKLNEQGEPVINTYQTTLAAGDFPVLNKFGQDPQQFTRPAKANGAIISQTLAKQLEAKVGDTIRVNYGLNSIDFEVSEIRQDHGLIGGKTMIVEAGFVREELGLPANSYTNFYVSAAGGIEPTDYEGAEFKKDIEQVLADYDSANNELLVTELKQMALDGFGLGFFSTMFLILSFFGVFAGLLLIVNLYAMLAEERKYEMGILRAIAMTRWQLMRSFIYEGYLYSVISSLVGTIVGIAIGYLLVNIFGKLFGDLLATGGNEDIFRFSFGIELSSLIIAFSLGAVITILTAMVASFRISKLNIVAAIRDTEEEKVLKLNLKWILGTTLVGFFLINSLANLVLAFFIGDLLRDMRQKALETGGQGLAAMSEARFDETVKLAEGYTLYMGAVLSVLFVAWFINRVVRLATGKDYSRIILSIANLFTVVFTGLISEIPMIRNALLLNSGAALMFVSSMVLVIACSILISLNLDIFTFLARFALAPLPNSSSVVKIAMRYPAVNRSRTGLTLTMFAVIIYLIVFLSINKALVQETQSTATNRALGGYEVWVSPMPDVNSEQLEVMSTKIAGVENVSKVALISNVEAVLPEYKYGEIQEYPYYGDPAFQPRYEKGDAFKTALNALPADFIRNSDVDLGKRAAGYASDEAVWQAVIADKTKVVIGTAFIADSLGPRPNLEVGDKIKIADRFERSSYEAEIIGITKTDFTAATSGFGFFNNIITTREAVEASFSSEYVDDFSRSTVLVAIADNASTRDTINALKKAIISYNIAVVYELDEILGASQAFTDGLFLMLQGFLAFSLIIGTSGLAIIITRSVNERRQQIGMLRSLGFQRSMVLGSFFIESTFITVLSLVIGISMGILGMYTLIEVAKEIAPDYKLVIPWQELGILVLVVYLTSILFSLLPSIKAARLSPVEATNYPE